MPVNPTRSLKKTASWVIREKDTGNVLFETWREDLTKKINTQRYEAIPILDYLQELNSKIKRGNHET